MSNSSSISLPREKCLKCGEESILLSSNTPFEAVIGNCEHRFCQNCFRKENTTLDVTSSENRTFKCPCCHVQFYQKMLSTDEAILIGEAVTLCNHISPQLLSTSITASMTVGHLSQVHKINSLTIEKLEAVLQLNSRNIFAAYLLFICCSRGQSLLCKEKDVDFPNNLYTVKLANNSFKILDSTIASEQGFDDVKCECYYQLSRIFNSYGNYPAAHKYAKLSYEHGIRSTNSSRHANLQKCKAHYLELKSAFDKLPQVRFSLGDEVEFLHEPDAVNEWKKGKIVELYYWERALDLGFSAPYRLQLLIDNERPQYAVVKADLDRYIRKVGVRSIEDTRYRARLDAKIEKLVQVYCSDLFIQDVHRALAQDREFVGMLLSVWQVELSETTVQIYRALVMFRQPFICTDTGYHVPSTEEAIAGIRAFFDPVHLSAASENNMQQIRANVISVFLGNIPEYSGYIDDNNIQGLLLHGIMCCMMLAFFEVGHVRTLTSLSLHNQNCNRVPVHLAEAISKSSTTQGLKRLRSTASTSVKSAPYYLAWVAVHTCLENPDARLACECPFVYFFVKYCLDQGAGVPKMALAVYDRMNMQLSREFIRCTNPTCELNRLDKSTGQVKFKKCSRCHAVIYCSRECQVAHYPEHKRLCREHSTG